jgi:CubicO group peptidase (beta-lactamase class C family)
MKDSGVIAPPPGKTAKLSSAYARQGEAWVDISYSPLNFILGHDGVVSTIEDMTRWAAAVQAGKLLPADLMASVFVSGSTRDGRPTNYGFGWRMSELEGNRVFQHEGCWSGYRNGIVYDAGSQRTAVVLSNAGAEGQEFWDCDEGLSLARRLLSTRR